MKCQRCQCPSLASVSGKTADQCIVNTGNSDCGPDYVPYGMGIGGGDMIQFSYCLECGQIQGEFPISPDCR